METEQRQESLAVIYSATLQNIARLIGANEALREPALVSYYKNLAALSGAFRELRSINVKQFLDITSQQASEKKQDLDDCLVKWTRAFIRRQLLDAGLFEVPSYVDSYSPGAQDRAWFAFKVKPKNGEVDYEQLKKHVENTCFNSSTSLYKGIHEYMGFNISGNLSVLRDADSPNLLVRGMVIFGSKKFTLDELRDMDAAAFYGNKAAIIQQIEQERKNSNG